MRDEALHVCLSGWCGCIEVRPLPPHFDGHWRDMVTVSSDILLFRPVLSCFPTPGFEALNKVIRKSEERNYSRSLLRTATVNSDKRFY